MNGRLAKFDDYVKQFHKTEKKIQNRMKDLKKQNKMLFNISKKTSNRREMNKINKINKSRYDFLSRDNSRVSSESNSRDSLSFTLVT